MKVIINPYHKSVTIDGVEVVQKFINFPDALNHLASISCDYDRDSQTITDVQDVHRYVSHAIEKQYYYKHLPEFVDWFYAEQQAQLDNAISVEQQIVAANTAAQNAATSAEKAKLEAEEAKKTNQNTQQAVDNAVAKLTQAGSTLPVKSDGTDIVRTLGERFADVANVKDFGAVGDGETDDTAAIQAALDSGTKIVFFPPGTYKVTGLGLKVHRWRQVIEFSGQAQISGTDITGDAVMQITGQFARLIRPHITCDDTTETTPLLLVGLNEAYDWQADATTHTVGFSCYIEEPYLSGRGAAALLVGALECRVIGGQFKQAKYGIRVRWPDFWCSDVYCEGNTSHGFFGDNATAIEAYHLHAPTNKGNGIHLVNCARSNFYGIYADHSYQHGIHLEGDCACTSFYGGRGYRSDNNGTKLYSDWHIDCANQVQLIDCFASGNDEKKAWSFWVGPSSNVYMVGCMTDKNAYFATPYRVRCQGCRGMLQKYNRDETETFLSNATVPSGETVTFEVIVPISTNLQSPGVLAFEVTYQWRDNSGLSSIGRALVQQSIGTGVTLRSSGIHTIWPTSTVDVQVSAADGEFVGSGYKLILTIKNDRAYNISLGGVVKYLGTARGNL